MKSDIEKLLDLLYDETVNGFIISEDVKTELKDYLTNLQEENKILRRNTDLVNLELIEYKNDLEDKIDKAIEYITSEETINMFSSINDRENWLKINHKLLYILKGIERGE